MTAAVIQGWLQEVTHAIEILASICTIEWSIITSVKVKTISQSKSQLGDLRSAEPKICYLHF